MKRARAPEVGVEGSPALELRDEDREAIVELLAELLADQVGDAERER